MSAIMLPNGGVMERKFENALVMEKKYKEKFDKLFSEDTRAGVVLSHIILNADEHGRYVCAVSDLGKAVGYSQATVTRCLKVIKEQYSDLMSVKKTSTSTQTHINEFVIDTNRCFKSVEGREQI